MGVMGYGMYCLNLGRVVVVYKVVDRNNNRVDTLKKTHIAVNDKGRRIGESHPRAKLTDHEVDLIRELIEEGMSLREVAAKFDIRKSHAQRIASCANRAQTVADLRPVDPTPREYSPADGTDRKARAIRS